MTARRCLFMTALVIALLLSISACGSFKGDKEVDTQDGEGGIGKGRDF